MIISQVELIYVLTDKTGQVTGLSRQAAGPIGSAAFFRNHTINLLVSPVKDCEPSHDSFFPSFLDFQHSVP